MRNVGLPITSSIESNPNTFLDRLETGLHTSAGHRTTGLRSVAERNRVTCLAGGGERGYIAA